MENEFIEHWFLIGSSACLIWPSPARRSLPPQMTKGHLRDVAFDRFGDSEVDAMILFLLLHRALLYFVLSHFVCATFSFGWLTKRCHTTAWNASECGVMLFGFTVGITITTSATFAV